MADPVEKPTDRRAVAAAGVLVLVVGIVVLATVEETMHGLQRMFLVGGIALAGCWAMLAAVTTEAGRATVRGLTLGVVLGLLPVGFIGMVISLID
ncbi:hypothetical protein EFK50_21350 [Nocardioides marmoriginsengisoli]|uniref:Uncharacterized protein n=1 Tax=Nocardioides marmoriginsengisoli TaxID=661483 RepID=A0A3N0C901_9ACTN|nr:hypothetical protein [Nocardioides marmoriginsengisoli]RNL59937.1 hypothetical protein EFK50_21350 [Nocardioides marmoriginsengisoli]